MRAVFLFFFFVSCLNLCPAFRWPYSVWKWRRCSDPPLRIRQQIANLIVVGKVKDIGPVGYKIYNANIKVFRVLKNTRNWLQPPGDDRYAVSAKDIFVRGFGDPAVCKNMVTRGNVRIFLLDQHQSGEIKLNSSIVRLTGWTLKRLKGFIEDYSLVPTTPRPDPCRTKYCPFHSTCYIDRTGKARCQCISTCSPTKSRVCGTDGRTYHNECFLKQMNCFRKRRVNVLYKAACDRTRDPCEQITCGYGSKCQRSADGLTARCECQTQCFKFGSDVESERAVCGDDGKDYESICEMNRAACDKMTNIKIKYYGKCDPCKGKCNQYETCTINSDRNPICKCSETCPENFDPICASNGQTYTNECAMKRDACKRDTNKIYKLYAGQCRKAPSEIYQLTASISKSADRPMGDSPMGPRVILSSRSTENNPCAKVKCNPGQECLVDRIGRTVCTCPQSCPSLLRPVCGSDAHTYENECQLKQISCQEQREVTIKYHGKCGIEDPCYAKVCDFYAVCVNRNNKPFCTCPSCSEIYVPVCGTDNVTYTNECLMRQNACLQRRIVLVKRQGECRADCSSTECEYGATCKVINKEVKCVCDFGCDSYRNQVCGSDNRLYDNECRLKEAACKNKFPIKKVKLDLCLDKLTRVLPCDGRSPLINPKTGLDYDCSATGANDRCPIGSICHMTADFAKCCKEDECQRSDYGCCADGKSRALGPGRAGCPEECGCQPEFSYGQFCHPTTRQCNCRIGVAGQTCNACRSGYWGIVKISQGYKGCTPCNCNVFGAVRPDCDQMSGKCVCDTTKSGVFGDKCDRCPPGKALTGSGCVPASALEQSTLCGQLRCVAQAICRITGTEAKCVCEHLKCISVALPVCGSDGQTYHNLCNLELRACESQNDLLQKWHDGHCTQEETRKAITGNQRTTRQLTTMHTTTPYGVLGDSCQDNEDCIVKGSYCNPNISTCICLPNLNYVPRFGHCKVATTKAPAPFPRDPCLSYPCRNGSTCIGSVERGYNCLCPLGFAGPTCHRVTGFNVPGFGGRSYLKFKRLPRTRRDFTLELKFSSYNLDALILFNSEKPSSGDFVSVAIVNGYVEFRYDLGSGAALIKSKERIIPGHYHTLVVNRYERGGSLQLDRNDEVYGQSPGPKKSLNLKGNLYLGYVPHMSRHIAKRTGVKWGLSGCINYLSLRTDSSPDYSYTLSYEPSLRRHKDIRGGAHIVDCGFNACASLPCINGGTCTKWGGNSFFCQCPPAFTGSRCEEQVAQSRRIRAFESEVRVYNSTKSKPSPVTSAIKLDGHVFPSYNEHNFSSSVHSNLTVSFRTAHGNGLLLLQYSNDSSLKPNLLLNVRRARVQLRYAYEYVTSTTSLKTTVGFVKLKSKVFVSDNRWHTIVIQRSKAKLSISIDGGTESSVYLPSGAFWRYGQSTLRLGGHKASSIHIHKQLSTPFRGCVRTLQISHKLLDLFRDNLSRFSSAKHCR